MRITDHGCGYRYSKHPRERAGLLDPRATQPTILPLTTGGFLTAVEFNNGSGGQLRLRHYPTIQALLDGAFDRERTIARTLSACNEGTPVLYSASLTPDIDHSVIDVGFHYHQGCDVDRTARGALTNFKSWTAAAEPDVDAAIIAAAGKPAIAASLFLPSEVAAPGEAGQLVFYREYGVVAGPPTRALGHLLRRRGPHRLDVGPHRTAHRRRLRRGRTVPQPGRRSVLGALVRTGAGGSVRDVHLLHPVR